MSRGKCNQSRTILNYWFKSLFSYWFVFLNSNRLISLLNVMFNSAKAEPIKYSQVALLSVAMIRPK